MAEWGLPCVVCGKELRNVAPDITTNQPSEGLCFWTHGTYGSTVFDPFDGTYIEINICDECVVEAGEQGRVLSGRDKRPVNISRWGTCGWERVDRALVPWTKDLASYDADDCVNFDLEEALEYEDDKRISWTVKPSELVEAEKRRAR